MNSHSNIDLPAIYDDLTWKQRKDVRERYIVMQKGLCASTILVVDNHH